MNDEEFIIVNNIKYKINLEYEFRKTANVSIKNETINIKLPKLLSKKKKYEIINKFAKWAKKKLLKQKLKPKEIIYKQGEYINTEKKNYVLNFIKKDIKNITGKIVHNNLIINLPKNIKTINTSINKIKISKLIGKLIASDQKTYIENKISKINNRFFNEKINLITIKNMRTRWGSCSSKKNINLSTKLLLVPEYCLDYVIVHEIAHLKQPNHSKKFWIIVENIIPEYKKINKHLKDNGYKYNF